MYRSEALLHAHDSESVRRCTGVRPCYMCMILSQWDDVQEWGIVTCTWFWASEMMYRSEALLHAHDSEPVRRCIGARPVYMHMILSQWDDVQEWGLVTCTWFWACELMYLLHVLIAGVLFWASETSRILVHNRVKLLHCLIALIWVNLATTCTYRISSNSFRPRSVSALK